MAENINENHNMTLRELLALIYAGLDQSLQEDHSKDHIIYKTKTYTAQEILALLEKESDKVHSVLGDLGIDWSQEIKFSGLNKLVNKLNLN